MSVLTATARASFSSPLYKIWLYSTHLVWTQNRFETRTSANWSSWCLDTGSRYYVTLTVLASLSAGACWVHDDVRSANFVYRNASCNCKYLTQMAVSRERRDYGVYCCNPVSCLPCWQLIIIIIFINTAIGWLPGGSGLYH